MAHSASRKFRLCDSDKFLTGSSLLVLNQAWIDRLFLLSSLSRQLTIVGADFPRNQAITVGTAGCPNSIMFFHSLRPLTSVFAPTRPSRRAFKLLSNLFCPNFLGRRSLDLPVNRTLSPKQFVRQATRFHSADVAKPVKSSLLDLCVGCSWHHLRMVSFDIWSCNETPRIWRRHHYWNAVQVSVAYKRMGTISVLNQALIDYQCGHKRKQLLHKMAWLP